MYECHFIAFRLVVVSEQIVEQLSVLRVRPLAVVLPFVGDPIHSSDLLDELLAPPKQSLSFVHLTHDWRPPHGTMPLEGIDHHVPALVSGLALLVVDAFFISCSPMSYCAIILLISL
jgi:hypothetical protein